MPHTTIQTDGSICYRSKLIPLALAASFARCIDSNSRFTDVEIVPTQSGEKAHVRFRPVSLECRRNMVQAEADKRTLRAANEGEDYVFAPDCDDLRRSFVFNPHTGETYEMWMGHCSCPDKRFRCEKAGLHCKHEQERDRRYATGTLYATDKKTPATLEKRFASRSLRVDLDF